MTDTITRRTFADVLAASRLSASAKRELLALHHAELTRASDEAEARCLSPDLRAAVRELVDGAVIVTRAETLGDVAQELQRFGTATERAAQEAAHEARVNLALAFNRIPAALALDSVAAREDRLRALRDAERLPHNDPDRSVAFGPCPLGTLAKRARESGVTITRTTEEDADR